MKGRIVGMQKPVGPYREAAMALIFEHDRVVYDPEEAC
jgi:hypothetical protein